jgi:hypothetical protein
MTPAPVSAFISEDLPRALGAHRRTGPGYPVEPPGERGDPVAREPLVGLDLAFAGAPGADPSPQALEVRPETSHSREVVLELGELDLEFSLCAVGVAGKDVEDDGRAVDHRELQGGLQVPLLAGRELVVGDDHVCVGALCLRADLVELARSHIGVWVGPVPALDR